MAKPGGLSGVNE